MVTALPHKRILLTVIPVLILICVLFCPSVHASEKLRVGYISKPNLMEVDKYGRYSGYTYEYLQEISQYTGWEYEFIQIPGSTGTSEYRMTEMLEKGELDLIGSTVYTDKLANVMDFPGYSYGMAYTILCVPESSTTLNEMMFPNKGVRIAVLDNDYEVWTKLEQYCDMNGIMYEPVICKSVAEQLSYLQDGSCDAMTGTDLTHYEGTRTIAKFHPQPYYFAASKGNTGIINQLDSAILKINEADPYFSTTLYEKYFGAKQQSFRLTKTERTYIDGLTSPIQAAFAGGKAPFQYIHPQTREVTGISRDLLAYISNVTGLDFEIVYADSNSNFISMLQNSQVQIAAGIPYDYELAESYNVMFTRPFAASQTTMVLNSSIDPSNLAGKRLALPSGVPYDGQHLRSVTWYPTVEACVEAVNSGHADYTYGNGYCMQYYANQPQYSNISLVPQSGLQEKICFGVIKPADPKLLSIMNKAIRSIPEAELEEILYRNTFRAQTNITLSSFVTANPVQSIVITSVTATVLTGLLVLILLNGKKSNRKIALENERYQQLCALSNEFLFEYNYEKDSLMLLDNLFQIESGRRVIEHYYAEEKCKPVHNDFIRVFFEPIHSQMNGSLEFNSCLSSGEQRWLRITSKTIRDTAGHIIYLIGKVADIQHEQEERMRLMERAQKDGLTSIYNSLTCRQLISDAIASGQQGSLFVIDLDYFKSINDRYGHFVGDQVLSTFSAILCTSFRNDDIIGRLGGDEFIVFMRGVRSMKNIVKKCHALRHRISDAILSQYNFSVSLSIGIAVTESGISYNQLFQSADQALYEVKNQGRDNFKIAPPAKTDSADEHTEPAL